MVHLHRRFTGVRDLPGLNVGWADGPKLSLRWSWRGRQHRLRFRFSTAPSCVTPSCVTFGSRVTFGHQSWITCPEHGEFCAVDGFAHDIATGNRHAFGKIA